MRHRQNEIRKKGFSISTKTEIPQDAYQEDGVIDFSKIRVGVKTLDDAVLDINPYKRISSQLGDKEIVLQALYDNNLTELREISNLFFNSSGVYERVCKYVANIFRYDWYLIPYIEKETVKPEKILKDFSNILKYLDNSNIAKACGEMALSVVKNGCFYGYIIDNGTNAAIQELPIKYCRSRFSKNGLPTVEFNMKYFDDAFSDIQYRIRVLNMFPKDFQKGYMLFKQQKLKPEFQGDTSGWYLLDTDCAFKLNCGGPSGGSDVPLFANAIPAIIDLNEAQALDRKKMMQQLLKIVIQKLPIDKNGDLVFDVDEAADLHNNAVQMLRRAVGLDVLTTFADTDVIDMSDSNTTTTRDDLNKVERTLFNEFGVPQGIFNSDSNMALNNSIATDEASMRNLLQQLNIVFERITKRFNTNPKNYFFKFKFLETTAFNYKELAKMYKEQTQTGFSKVLPQVALGHSQSEIIAMANFENNILNLAQMMIPPMTSNTMSGDALLGKGKEDKDKTDKTNSNENQKQKEEDSTPGRPEKDDSEKSDKTIANREAM